MTANPEPVCSSEVKFGLPDRKSRRIFEAAKHVFPGGTTRVTVERNPYPRYAARGEGAFLTDIDGNRLLDLNNNYTTLIHGHAYPPVVDAVRKQLVDGSCFANPTQSEVTLADLLCERVPGLDRVRFVNSGTEAVMFAIKAARAATGRTMVAKIEGAYHGAYDWAEVGYSGHPKPWGDGDYPNVKLPCAGIPKSVVDDVIVLRFNDVDDVRSRLAEHADQIACFLFDPMPSRVGLVAPESEFIEAIVECCEAYGILLISDEVLNLRQAYEGASCRYGFRPDLFCLGKIIGGGLPIGAVGGAVEVMHVFDASASRPLVPQGGTFSANPLSMVAGFAAMSGLDRKTFGHLECLGNSVREGLQDVIARHSAPFCVTGAASLFRIHPQPFQLRDFLPTDCGKLALSELTRFFMRNGISLPNAAAASLSVPMTFADGTMIIDVFERFLLECRDVVDTLTEAAGAQ